MELDAGRRIVSNNLMQEKTVSSRSKIQNYPVLVALFTQVIVLFFLRNFFYLTHWPVSAWSFVFLQSFICALLVKAFFRLPYWIAVISILLPPLVFGAFHYLSITSTFYGVGFVILALTFSHTLKERVPLYLTNQTTNSALLKIIHEKQVRRVVDLGSGFGGVVRSLASKTVESVGVETAPVLWLLSSFLCSLTRRGRIERKNIWKTDLSYYNLVYAFLSPAVMEKLWEKVQSEMQPGSLFVSNSFMVPGVKPSQVLTLEDGRKTKLYLYAIK